VLTFEGAADSRPAPAPEQIENGAAAPDAGSQNTLAQVVVAADADLIGKTIRDTGFRGRFDAAVIAVKRNDVKQGGRLGDVVLRKGDVVVLSVGTSFDAKAPDFTKNFKKWVCFPLGGWAWGLGVLHLLRLMFACLQATRLLVCV